MDEIFSTKKMYFSKEKFGHLVIEENGKILTILSKKEIDTINKLREKHEKL